MTHQLHKITSNSSVAACLGALISAGVSLWAAYTASQSADRIANLQNRQQIMSNLDSASSQLIAEGGKLIFDVNNSRPLKSVKDNLATYVAQQMQQAELVKIPLKLTNEDVQFYEDALSDFEHKTDAVRGVADMPEWSESFGHLLDVQRVLSQRLAKSST